jgi:anthranilate synthase/aminodeoxychorismate synthase-like glutamine amidotransferase
MKRDVLLIDNFDSFTYNLVEEFACLGCRVQVHRNDVPLVRLQDILAELHDPLIVLSPGPGTPSEAGVCIELIRAVAGRYALLGICLGHQALTVAFGGIVEPAPRAAHAERSMVNWAAHVLFEGLPNPLSVGRYHSLAASQLSPELKVIASVDDVIMAVTHTEHALAGLQFHPESVLTTSGRHLLSNAARSWRECA